MAGTSYVRTLVISMVFAGFGATTTAAQTSTPSKPITKQVIVDCSLPDDQLMGQVTLGMRLWVDRMNANRPYDQKIPYFDPSQMPPEANKRFLDGLRQQRTTSIGGEDEAIAITCKAPGVGPSAQNVVLMLNAG